MHALTAVLPNEIRLSVKEDTSTPDKRRLAMTDNRDARGCHTKQQTAFLLTLVCCPLKSVVHSPAVI